MISMMPSKVRFFMDLFVELEELFHVSKLPQLIKTMIIQVTLQNQNIKKPLFNWLS